MVVAEDDYDAEEETGGALAGRIVRASPGVGHFDMMYAAEKLFTLRRGSFDMYAAERLFPLFKEN